MTSSSSLFQCNLGVIVACCLKPPIPDDSNPVPHDFFYINGLQPWTSGAPKNPQVNRSESFPQFRCSGSIRWSSCSLFPPAWATGGVTRCGKGRRTCPKNHLPGRPIIPATGDRHQLCMARLSVKIWTVWIVGIPIGSMYAIYGNIYHQYTPNVGIYTIHTDPMG